MDDRATLTRFEGLASTYDRFRPTYPAAVFSTLLPGLGASPLVADVGCGTGISSRLLRVAGARVIGIDPSQDMLRQARERSGGDGPPIEFRQGTGEATGLADGSVDVVLAAQAFHWFDPPRALAEFHRILRPGGRAALLWNLRVADGGFTDDYTRIVVSAAESLDPSARAGRESLDAPLRASSLFRDAVVHDFDSPQTLDEEGAVGRATSASYFPRTEPERSARLEELRAAFRRHATDGVATLAHVARLTMATRVP
ncbi:MAG: class I SAM-dependent methyltransferase [Phycisphaerae bacterium]|nr:class I SAM-dependent methyltransferase [Phycisphaerae bacterium]